MENPQSPQASQSVNNGLVLANPADATFNFVAVLQGRASSTHTYRAYARWIDRYLADMTGVSITRGRARRARMEALPLNRIVPIMNSTLLRTWLGQISVEQQGKQALNQARSAIITLSSLLSEAGWLDDYTAAAMTNVRIPRAETGQRQGRWLSVEQVKLLMQGAEDIATTNIQRARNAVIIRLLCVMALRREELTEIRWKDLHTQAGRPVLLIHGKGSKSALVDIPNVVLKSVQRWAPYMSEDGELPSPERYLLCGFYKSGRPRPGGLTADAIWRVVKDSARHAGLGNVAPHDLRRSVAGNLEQSGVPIETISRLLRHSNIAITQQYLSKLPRENEGALLMADLLDFDPD
ncbi:MAG: site-specific integrase [Chloroflexi bacterium]|nr:site-specific integrase [Chloroflexota bacterium]